MCQPQSAYVTFNSDCFAPVRYVNTDVGFVSSSLHSFVMHHEIVSVFGTFVIVCHAMTVMLFVVYIIRVRKCFGKLYISRV